MFLTYFGIVVLAFLLTLGWSIFRLRQFDIYRKPLIEGTLINFTIHILGCVWWIVINRNQTYFIVPGIIYYVLSVSIIQTINWNLLSLLKPKGIQHFMKGKI
ncbi:MULTISPECIES: hypothetical protein [Heyndrickxia]|uniref:hypothetical protein n=1 Tax=Heyndrickxia TaxID=2837504 RepID=UPI001B17972E|nr:hypothetical protein [Heyndrickxia oleronia]GIN37379.1 hypothetical protein J19TS1_03280 [Heyndrickxia oleronia]